MRKIKITRDVLSETFSACSDQWMRLEPGETFWITDDQETNFPIVVEALDRGLQVGWLIRQLRGAPHESVDDWNDWTGVDGTFEAQGGAFRLAGYLADAVGVYFKHKGLEK